ncbi:jg18889 [Pararge aegeria aegeria]|uniref:Jg18889 protein n=1 Tax=Pararge aegeria aegeria TaxID=348720 RepID=A0A8S4RW32_9NEOP|nr:jg18889 [Pararge aegeria aegeria]
MNKKYKSETRKSSVSVASETHPYDDDIQLQDVPLSESMTRSLKALNKYVKKNIFFDESEEPIVEKDDSAYFSKENSPNESMSKSDSDSIKSNISNENRNEIIASWASTHNEQNVDKITSIFNDPVTLTDDYKFNKLLENSTSNFMPEICIESYEENMKVDKNLDSIPPDIPKRVNVNNLLETSVKNISSVHNEIVQSNEHKLSSTSYSSTSLPERTSSLTNINKSHDYTYKQDTGYKPTVALRKKPVNNDCNLQDNRHTIHDLSEWVNRTDIYPDVYAPLPYKSPSRRYVESDVNIHYRCPVRHDPLPLVPERELALQQAEHMKRLYREQRRNKYLQENNIQHADIDSFDASIKELQDMQNRRHQDNFMPSQKTVVPLNRYDEAEKIVAKALYTFNGQTARELSFRKGDIINVRKQIDSNWYEGEVHGKVGLFPYNYVELLKGEGVQTHKKPAVVEGRARAKFDFIAQTNLELPLKKGEVVVLSRRIDHNWWEGRNANRTGIFPDSYITILQEPSPSKPETQPLRTTDKPVASPAAHGLLNGTDKRSMGSHSYTPQPNSPALSNAPPATQPLSGYVTKSSQGASASERGYGPPTGAGVDLNNTEPLYVDTNAEAVPYRAMYKYRPQNPDELELNEGDTVYVLEKCDDGWYVGSSQRTGRFGTFPGNYVERI